MSDIAAVLIWWSTISLIGLIFLPLTLKIFAKFLDKGYAFSKILGIVLTSYTVWLLASLNILPFAKITILILLLGVTIIGLWSFINKSFQNIFRSQPWGLFILEEILFLAGLSFWSYIKAFEPSIRGLEKFMDFGFVNSILRSNYFPPLDMWLTKSPEYSGGFHINYYYFGHYITAFLTKLSGIDSAVAYNLMLSTLFAFTFTLSFSTMINLIYFYLLFKSKNISEAFFKDHNPVLWIKTILVGLLAGFIVSLGGNLHTIYVFTSGYPNENPVPPWKLELGYNPQRYWYPNATRFIPFTIHEFPAYSFVVSDLHGHVSDIPIVFLGLNLLFSIMIDQKLKRDKDEENASKNNPASTFRNFFREFDNHTSIPFLKLLLLGLLLGVMYMTNAWDGIIYMILSGFVFLFLNFIYQEENQTTAFFSIFYKTFSASLFLLFFFLIFSLPFSLNFKPFASGVGVLCAPKALLGKSLGPLLFEVGKCQKSPLYMLAILWGFFYFHVLGFFLFIFKSGSKEHPKMKSVPSNSKTGSEFWLKVKSVKIINACYKILQNLNPSDAFVFLIIVISTLLLIFPEFFYLKDIYPAHYRANTMFKLGYQAFMMLGIVSVYVIYRLRSNHFAKSLPLTIFNFVSIVLVVLVSIYPYFAVNSYFGNLKNYSGLYGLNWMKNQYPDDFALVSWIRENINCKSASGKDCQNQPVIVEANGESYTDYARISANTGLPTIIGWPVHEWLWRGSYDEAGKRIPEVATIYESTDLEKIKTIFRKYNVSYVVVGSLEREKYPKLQEKKFADLGNIVFQSNNSKIYKINSF